MESTKHGEECREGENVTKLGSPEEKASNGRTRPVPFQWSIRIDTYSTIRFNTYSLTGYYYFELWDELMHADFILHYMKSSVPFHQRALSFSATGS